MRREHDCSGNGRQLTAARMCFIIILGTVHLLVAQLRLVDTLASQTGVFVFVAATFLFVRAVLTLLGAVANVLEWDTLADRRAGEHAAGACTTAVSFVTAISAIVVSIAALPNRQALAGGSVTATECSATLRLALGDIAVTLVGTIDHAASRAVGMTIAPPFLRNAVAIVASELVAGHGHVAFVFVAAVATIGQAIAQLRGVDALAVGAAEIVLFAFYAAEQTRS